MFRGFVETLAGADLDAIPGPRRAPEIQSFVIVIGPTGVGKSTIVNILYNRSHHPDMCVTPARVGDSSASVTKFPNLHIDIKTGTCLLDTVGIGDPEMDKAMLERAIRGLVNDTAKGINAIVVVMRMGRVSDADRANLMLLTELFNPSDLKSHAVLLATHWEGELGQEEKDLSDWVQKDPEMKTFLELFAMVLPTNNSLKGRYAYPECRQQRLRELLDFISCQTARVYTRPVSIAELLLRLVRRFVQFWVGPPRLLVSTLKVMWSGEEALPTCCGQCSVCLEPIFLQCLCKLDCDHTFHLDCISSVQPTRCPDCRADFTPGEWFAML